MDCFIPIVTECVAAWPVCFMVPYQIPVVAGMEIDASQKAGLVQLCPASSYSRSLVVVMCSCRRQLASDT